MTVEHREIDLDETITRLAEIIEDSGDVVWLMKEDARTYLRLARLGQEAEKIVSLPSNRSGIIDKAIDSACRAVGGLPPGKRSWDEKEYMVAEVAAKAALVFVGKFLAERDRLAARQVVLEEALRSVFDASVGAVPYFPGEGPGSPNPPSWHCQICGEGWETKLHEPDAHLPQCAMRWVEAAISSPDPLVEAVREVVEAARHFKCLQFEKDGEGIVLPAWWYPLRDALARLDSPRSHPDK